MRTFIDRRPVAIYFLLTLAISWGGILAAVGFGVVADVSEESKALLPVVYGAMLAGPSLAGLLLTGLIDGRAGLRSLRSRLLRWRVGVRWYAAALLIAPGTIVCVLAALAQLSPTFRPQLAAIDAPARFVLANLTVGLLVGLFEELGWTGFAVPKLRLRHGILTTGLSVGLLWGGWHFLVFRERDTFSAAFPLILLLCRLFAWLPPYRTLMVWVADRTGSLLLAILMHSSLVAAQFTLVPATLTGTDLLVWILAWAASLWIVVGVVATISDGHFAREGFDHTIHAAHS